MNLDRARRADWTRGQLLAFSALDGETDYDHGLILRTATGPAGIDVKAPGECTLRFTDPPVGDVLVTSDSFDFRTAGGRMRGVLLDAHHLLVEGECTPSGDAEAVTVRSAGARTLLGSAKHFRADLLDTDIAAAMDARLHWLRGQPLAEGLPEATYRTMVKALSTMKGQVWSAEGPIRHRWTTPDRFPHKDMWLWDSAFHAIGWRHFDPTMARDAISAMFDVQKPDGFVPYRASPRQSFDALTQPPVLALATQLVQEAAPKQVWLEGIYPRLAAYVNWDFAFRDRDGSGLPEWVFEEVSHCRCGESGMDNSPRFDQGLVLDAVDFAAYLALECEVLAELALRVGRPADAGQWRARHRELCRLMNERLWCERRGFYFDVDTQSQRQLPTVASSGFLPLICGAPSREQAARLVAHLHDPAMFRTAVPIASVAASDTEHYAKDCWRGPVWININWLVARGLDRYGHHLVAQQLRAATMAEIERQCEEHGTLFEFFDDRREMDPPELLRKGICDPQNPYRQVIHDYGWTTTLYVDMVCTGKAWGVSGAHG